MTDRLSHPDQLPENVARPSYTPADHGPGIVHIGLGAFHKAHQAVYTDTALGLHGGDWRIIGVSLRSPEAAGELAPQNGLYTLIERDMQGSSARVIGSIAAALCLPDDRQSILDALVSPATRIVSLTVTEKGYGIDRSTGGIDITHPAIAADLATPEAPIGVAGLLVWALAQRRAQGTPPFTVLCCDNLPENGPMLRELLVDFARRTAPDIAEHIATEVAFPATMVDRITPARNADTLAAAREMTGLEDAAAIETERFTQWVIEDHFPQGRPAWDAAGAIFVQDVAPFEMMKLRMLNGTHSMLAWCGFLSGHRYVRDVMRDAALVGLIRRHLHAAAATLPALPDVDLGAYADALATRFANPHLAHETYQIAMDSTEKLPQRILAAAVDAQAAGLPLRAFAFATAGWMRYALARHDTGDGYGLRDPREAEIAAALSGVESAAEIVKTLSALPGLFPETLRQDAQWQAEVTEVLDAMIALGMKEAIRREASASPGPEVGQVS